MHSCKRRGVFTGETICGVHGRARVDRQTPDRVNEIGPVAAQQLVFVEIARSRLDDTVTDEARLVNELMGQMGAHRRHRVVAAERVLQHAVVPQQ